MKKKLSWVLLALVLLSGCTNSNQLAESGAVGTTAGQQKPVYIMSGKIDSENQADVTTKISGKVAKVLVDVGSKVQQGQQVVLLDTSDLQAQVNQARATVSTAQANLNNITASARPEQIDQAQTTVDSAKQNYNTVQSNLDRIQQLYNSGAASLQQLETAQTQLSAAEAQYKSAQDQLSILKQGATATTIGVGQKQVAQAQAALETAETQLGNCTITAPISGTVTIKKINTGELAVPGALLVSIVNNGSISVNAFLPSDFSSQVKAGQKVLLKVAELPDKTFAGQISVINAEINSLNQSIQVKVSVPNPEGALKNGMFAEIALAK